MHAFFPMLPSYRTNIITHADVSLARARRKGLILPWLPVLCITFPQLHGRGCFPTRRGVMACRNSCAKASFGFLWLLGFAWGMMGGAHYRPPSSAEATPGILDPAPLT